MHIFLGYERRPGAARWGAAESIVRVVDPLPLHGHCTRPGACICPGVCGPTLSVARRSVWLKRLWDPSPPQPSALALLRNVGHLGAQVGARACPLPRAPGGG